MINNKKYVGCTKNNISSRWIQHKCSANHTTPKQYIHKAMNKHGIHNFIIEELEVCNNIDIMHEAEIKWIAHYDTFLGEGYNCTSGGETGNNSITTMETRKKISKAVSGKKNGFYGKTHSSESKRKMSISQKGNKNCVGRILSEETKRKIGKASKLRSQGENNPNYGRRGSDSQNAKKVFKVDKVTNEILECFFSMIDAALSVNSKPNFIGRVCSGGRKLIKGLFGNTLNDNYN